MYARSVTLLILAIAACAFLGTPSQAQIDHMQCGMEQIHSSHLEKQTFVFNTIGGKYKPSLTPDEEFLRALFVFVHFPDDQEQTPSWDDPNTLPSWALNIVDPTVQSIGTTDQYNLSNYYKRNSYDRFHFIGDVYYVELPHDEIYYHTLGSTQAGRNAIVQDALDILDPSVDFTRYDRWSSNGNYSFTFHTDGTPGDGVADMIYLVTRSLHDEANPPLNFFNLGICWALLGGYGLNLNYDGIDIDGSALDVRGSGISLFGTVTDGRVYIHENNNSLIGILVHELSHYHFDGNHFGNASISIGSHRNVSYFSAFSAHAGNCFSHHLGYEKYRLGWMTYSNDEIFQFTTNMIDRDVRLYEIGDPSTNHTKMIEILGLSPGSNQCLLLENRGRDIFEPRYAPYNAPNALLKPGILAYNMIEETYYLDETKASIITADGSFDWKLTIDGGGPSGLDVIDKDVANEANGYNKREKIWIRNPNTGNFYSQNWLAWFQPGIANGILGRGPYPKCTNLLDLHSSAADNVGYMGELFEVGSTLTKYTNPSPRLWNSSMDAFEPTINLGIRVLSFDPTDNSYLVRISRDTGSIYQYPPSIPQGFGVHYSSSSSCVSLRWNPSLEPFVCGLSGLKGTYVIERSVGSLNAWSTVATLSADYHEWSDSYANMPDGITKVYYRLYVVDGWNQQSEYTEPIEVNIARGSADDTNTPYVFQEKMLFVIGDFQLFHGLELPGLTHLYFCPNTTLYDYDTLMVNQIETNEYSKVECMTDGVLIFDAGANVDKLHTVIAHENSTVRVWDGSLIRMVGGGSISLLPQSVIDADPIATASITAYYPTQNWANYWNGIVIEPGATGIIRNMHFRHGYPAIENYNYDVPIENCLFKRNMIGITSYGNNPVIRNCVIDSNMMVGLFGYNMSNDVVDCRFNRNYGFGIQLSNSWNYWLNNRIDTNYTGVYCYDASVPLFNTFNQMGNLDTTQGNSIRNNTAYGVLADNNSCVIFLADNSLHNNADGDFFLNNSSLIGVQNYPDPGNLPPNVTFVPMLAGSSWYSWGGPYPLDEPVLRKTNASGAYQAHMEDAMRCSAMRQSKKAAGHCKQAFHQASSFTEARGALLCWLNAITRGKKDNVLMTGEADSLSDDLIAGMDSVTRSASPSWQRLAINEVKAVMSTIRGNYSQALSQYQGMISGQTLPDSIARRVWLRVLELKRFAYKDNAGAYQAYLYLNGKYPESREAIIAKIILRIPLTQNEQNIYFLRKGTEDAAPASLRSLGSSSSWCESFPNPSHGTLTVRYKLLSDHHVQIAVYSLDGRLVRMAASDVKPKGTHDSVFDLSGVPAGMYFYKIDAMDIDNNAYTTFTGRINIVK
jgi:M6 family metalloprotease-like protein